jgi:hypothetical protein
MFEAELAPLRVVMNLLLQSVRELEGDIIRFSPILSLFTIEQLLSFGSPDFEWPRREDLNLHPGLAHFQDYRFENSALLVNCL